MEKNKYQLMLDEYNRKINNSDIDKIIQKAKEKSETGLTKGILKKLYSCLDVTSLNPATTNEDIHQFIENEINKKEDIEELPDVASICVYPSMVSLVSETLTSNIGIAAVVGGFPHAQTFIEVKVAEAALALAEGATEFDMVMDLNKFNSKDYEHCGEDIEEIKEVCKSNVLKIIIESGALANLQDIYTASILSLLSGADFIKTSTGKEFKGASYEAVTVMCLAIKDFESKTKIKKGIKISGGVSSINDCAVYFNLITDILGDEFIDNKYLRIGASKLRGVLENAILA